MVPVLWLLLGRPFPTDDIKMFLGISLNAFIILNFNIRFSDEGYFFPWHFKIIKYKHTSYQRLLGLWQKESEGRLEKL